MSLSKRSRVALIAFLVVLPLACGDAKDSATDTVAATDAPVVTDAPTTSAVPEQWEEMVAPADCMCGDGSQFSFFVRKANPAKVMFYFEGGGACFSVETCDPADPSYAASVRSPGDLADGTGIFEFDNPQNPFADYSVVYVPYCTGDLHLGTAVHDYGPNASGTDIVVHHNGFINGTAALSKLVELFPDASEVVVTGISAGSAPTPLYAGLVHDQLPDARITVIADGSGAYPDLEVVNSIGTTLWGTQGSVPDWPEISDGNASSLPGLYVIAGKHAPGITFARHDYAFDATQAVYGALAGFDSSHLVDLIDLNETQIEAGGVDLFSYISQGDSHTVLRSPFFYLETLNGVSFRQWVSDLVEGTPVTDVHCTDCD